MSEMNLDDHVGLPTERNRGAPPKYPFKAMAVGQSFLVLPEGDDTIAVVQIRIKNAVFRANRLFEGKFVYRPWGHGFRVWRMS